MEQFHFIENQSKDECFKVHLFKQHCNTVDRTYWFLKLFFFGGYYLWALSGRNTCNELSVLFSVVYFSILIMFIKVYLLMAVMAHSQYSYLTTYLFSIVYCQVIEEINLSLKDKNRQTVKWHVIFLKVGSSTKRNFLFYLPVSSVLRTWYDAMSWAWIWRSLVHAHTDIAW